MSDRNRNIVLVGFMGTGKSSVGQHLATALSLEYLDMDALIVQRQGKPIPRIFAEDGEPFFRSLERSLATGLSARSGLVISTGGGIVLNPDNIHDFARTGLVVCLTATPESILARVGNDMNRPLLAVPDKMGKIRSLLEARRPLYAAVPNQIPTDGLTVEQVAGRIILLYNK